MKILAILILSITIILMQSCNEDKDSTTEGVSLKGFTINQMDFINANEGWIYATVNGQDGASKILHSTNGFSTYSIVNEAPPRFRKIKFIDQDIGYGISWDGSDSLFYTKDGGKTWTNFINTYDDYDINYNGTYFVVPFDKENSDNFLMQTGVQFYNKDFSYSHEILFDNSGFDLHGGASGNIQHYSSVHVSSDNKISFTGVYKQIDAIYDEDKSYAAYSNNSTSLSLIELSDVKSSPERTVFSSDKVGYFTLKEDGGLYKTIDSGETWNKVYSFENTSMSKIISFGNDKDGAVLGDFLYLTKDGGNSFHKYETPESDIIENVVYVDYNNIYIVVMSVKDEVMEQKLMKISD